MVRDRVVEMAVKYITKLRIYGFAKTFSICRMTWIDKLELHFIINSRYMCNKSANR